MNSQRSLISKLKPTYFWDVDLAILDDANASRLIIDRVFSMGEIHEMNQLIQFYGKKKVVEVLCNLSYIDPKTFNFITKLFNKSAEEFRCYHRKQSNPHYWNS